MAITEPKSKKNIIYMISLGLVIAFLIGLSFIFFGNAREKLDLNTKEAVNTEMIQIKNLDLDIFQDNRFLGLKDSKTSLPDITELRPGKDNPFAADSF